MGLPPHGEARPAWMDPEPRMFLDGDRITPGSENCVCTSRCEMPCWQRIGLTTRACCPGCAPLPDHEEL